jgi:glycosyltransferase involved in cell wall biosynthesis
MRQATFPDPGGHAPLPAPRNPNSSPAVILMSVDAVGGVWRYAMELARALPRRGYRLVFAVLGPRPSAEQETEARRHGDLVWMDQPLDWMVDEPDQLAGVGRALSELAEECGADLLHLNVPSQAAGLGARIPIVAVAHSCLPTWWNVVKAAPLPRDWAWHPRLNRAGFQAAHSVVAPSGSHAEALTRCYGRIERLEVVYNGIAAFLPRERRERVLFAAGRWWDEGKNGRVLASATPHLDWPLVAAGALQGPTGQRVEMDGIRALGPIPHDRVLDHMRRAEIVVSPSIYEPFGLAALEGARAGASLLLADNPTYRELWKGAACFFDPSDPEDLAAQARALADDADMRAAYASAALARSRAFTPDRLAAAMDELYRRHLNRQAVHASEYS